MTIASVADTHAALWFLFGDPRLSATAKAFFEKAATARRKIRYRLSASPKCFT
jgi:PIN domain nuclease of toxin-antitoxin system